MGWPFSWFVAARQLRWWNIAVISLHGGLVQFSLTAKGPITVA